MPAVLSANAKAALDAQLAKDAANPDVPALYWGVTTADGPIYFGAKGERVRGQPSQGEVNESTLLQLWSMTKLVTTLACLQLVDQGRIDLDDASLIDRVLPELAALKIITGFAEDGSAQLKQRTQPLTLRHLLSHQSGLVYPDSHPLVRRYKKQQNIPGFFDPGVGIEAYEIPLVFEPGSHWVYGYGIDWAGFLVERVTGQSLEEYFSTNIFKPLGITTMSFYPVPDWDEKSQKLNTRDKNGKLVTFSGWRPTVASAIKTLSGGAGLFGTAKDYLRLLQGVLAAQKPGGVISPEAWKELFTSQFPPPSANPPHGAEIKEFMEAWDYLDWDSGVGFSLGLAVNAKDSARGRRAGSGQWGGASKTEFWIDPASGIAAFCGTQIQCWVHPDPFAKVFTGFERLVYDLIEEPPRARY